MYKVLVIDDDPKLASLLAEYLGERGFLVELAHEGSRGIELVHGGGIDAVILDVMLPGADGFTVLQELRRTSSVPVIMLTARGEELDRIVGLELGADDYLPKPFNPRELLARIKAILRRHQAEVEEEILHANGLRMIISRREVFIEEEIIELTTTEFEILRVLLSAKGRVVPRERLMEQARGEEWAAYDRSIDVHISHLRRKLGDDSRQPNRIKTIRGIGYLMPD